MPAQTQISAAPESLNAFNAKGDTAIGHSPDMVAHYRDLATQADIRRNALSGAGQQPAAPAEVPLPMTGVARHHLGREIQRLSCQAEAGRRDLAGRFTFGAGGQQISDPATLNMRAELVAGIEAAEAEAARLAGLDDHEARVWAAGRGVR